MAKYINYDKFVEYFRHNAELCRRNEANAIAKRNYADALVHQAEAEVSEYIVRATTTEDELEQFEFVEVEE